MFCWAVLRHPLHCSLQKGLLALTSAGAKHDCRQTSAISFRVHLWIVYAENIKQWLINLILPEVVFEQEENFVNLIIGKVFSIFKKKLNWRKTDLWSSCEDGFAWPLSHEEMVYTAEIFTAIKETHTRLEACLCSSLALTLWRASSFAKLTQDGTWSHPCRDLRLMSRRCPFDFLEIMWLIL